MEKLKDQKVNFNVNMEKIKNIKLKTDLINQEYHQNMEKLNFYEKDIEYMIKKTGLLDHKLEKLVYNFK